MVLGYTHFPWRDWVYKSLGLDVPYSNHFIHIYIYLLVALIVPPSIYTGCKLKRGLMWFVHERGPELPP